MHRPHRSPYPSGPILSPPPSAVPESCTDFSSALSPLLTYLLSLVYRDGFTGHTGLGLLRELYPYLQGQDARSVGHLLHAEDTAKQLSLLPVPTQCPLPRRAWLTQTERVLQILDILQRHGGQTAARQLEQLRRYILIRNQLLRCTQRGISAEALPDIVSLLDGGQSCALKQLQQLSPFMQMLSGNTNPMQLMQMMSRSHK